MTKNIANSSFAKIQTFSNSILIQKNHVSINQTPNENFKWLTFYPTLSYRLTSYCKIFVVAIEIIVRAYGNLHV